MSAVAEPLAAAPAPRADGYWAGVLKRVSRDRVTLVCGGILLLMLLAIVLAPYIAPYSPYQGGMLRRLKPFGFQGHVLGTDEQGRDMLTRLIYGGQLSWFIGITPVAIAFFVGGLLGVLAGFLGGWVDDVISRIIDTLLSFPAIVLAIAVTGALGIGLTNGMIAVGIVMFPALARIVRARTLIVRQELYVDASRCFGAPAFLRFHVLHLG
jgi:peptide/nickel transport system permease protein